MQRLTCIVEGRGDVLAFPNLCARIIQYLGVADAWIVDTYPIRNPRSRLVNEGDPSPHRQCNQDGIARALTLAATRNPAAVLIACDSDDDCPATWGPHATSEIVGRGMSGVAVMPVREYESWLLWNFPKQKRDQFRIFAPETIRDAKGALAKLFPNYLPTAHQLKLTREIDIANVRRDSKSFDKLVRGLAQLFNVVPPPR